MSEIPKIETFEHDIVAEVEGKNSNIADIASYSEELSNEKQEKTRKINFIIVTVSIILIVLSIIIIIIYTISSNSKPVQQEIPIEKLQVNQGSKDKVVYLFPNLNSNVGEFISNFEETPFGYIITISDFKEVYAFVMKNESVFAEDVLNSFKISLDANVTKDNIVFKDVNDSNQNMRVLEIGDKTVVYSWLNDNYLLVSKNINGILSMRSAIIK